MTRAHVISTTPLTKAEQAVFGVLRQADELWLEVWEIAKRSQMGIPRTTSAIRGLRQRGLVVTRKTEGAGLSKTEVSLAASGLR